MKKVLFGSGGVALIGAVVALVVIAVAGVYSSGSTSRTATQQDGAPAGAGAVNASQPGDAPGATSEGIAVHGHWTIEVHDTDGALVERREFENAITLFGRKSLAAILSRNAGPPAWGILLHTNIPDTGPCDTVLDAVGADCVIVEASGSGGLSTWPNGIFFKTLTISPAPATFGLATLTLQGTAIAKTNGAIDVVKSLICISFTPLSVDPTTCNNSDEFTAKALATPVSLSTGQQVLVTVTIDFS